ncbi:MAG: DUF3291 domain-containing protein [Solirubrobacteraceae bacterium]
MSFHVAQVNIALPKAPVDSPLLADFMALLDPINELADASDGFVWRLQTDEGNATSIRPFEDERLMVNLSTWESVEALRRFVYRSVHVEVMRRRREWFEHMRLYMALWWVPAGHVPSVEEAKDRLAHLREQGPTPHAITFREPVGPPDGSAAPLVDDELGCPA